MMKHALKRKAATLPAAFSLTLGAAAQAAAGPLPMDGDQPIASAFPYTKSFVEVNGAQLAYVDVGAGRPILFLHGNPTSSYLWRNILPYVAGTHRAIALDLVGMGDSEKPDLAYSFQDHARYLDGFIEALDLQDFVLVVHDWGAALGMRYARRHPEKVVAIAFMEALLPPALPAPSYTAMGPLVGPMFQALRAPGLGEELILRHNFFVESILGKFGGGRQLSEAELAHYRRPFLTRKSRLPTLAWPRQVPIAGEPSDVAAIVMANGRWLFSSGIPKLFFHATPGALIPPQAARFVIAQTKNLHAVDLGAGNHFLQESSPHKIGAALAQWLQAMD